MLANSGLGIASNTLLCNIYENLAEQNVDVVNIAMNGHWPVYMKNLRHGREQVQPTHNVCTVYLILYLLLCQTPNIRSMLYVMQHYIHLRFDWTK